MKIVRCQQINWFVFVRVVGKIRKQWLQAALSPTGVQALKAIKDSIDPKNIFGIQNLLPWMQIMHFHRIVGIVWINFADQIETDC